MEFPEDEYDDYAGHYLNVKEELKAGAEDTQSEMEEQPIDVDYELMAYSNTKIDYEYIIQSDSEHCDTRMKMWK